MKRTKKMKVIAITYYFSDVPGFSSLICQNEVGVFSPVFKDGVLKEFINADDWKIKLQPVKEDIELEIGDEEIFAYYSNDCAYVGDYDKVRENIRTLMERDEIICPEAIEEAMTFLSKKNSRDMTEFDEKDEININLPFNGEPYMVFQYSFTQNKSPHEERALRMAVV